MAKSDASLAVIGGSPSFEENGRIFTHYSSGRVVAEMASYYRRVVFCAPTARSRTSSNDCVLPPNLQWLPLHGVGTAASGLFRFRQAAAAYRKAIETADYVFVRGMLFPAVGTLYAECRRRNTPLIHWLISNPAVLVTSHNRLGWFRTGLARCYIKWWESQMQRGHARARAAYLCNGREIAARHMSERKHVVVSTSTRSVDFYRREDTCTGDTVRILCVAFVRPEKGIEYLLQAISRLKTSRPTELRIVGSRDRYPAHQSHLDRLVYTLGLDGRVDWLGHATYKEVERHLREADLFAFPSLSEGTPRVLVEARANGLPVVSTNVGGIASSVEDGVDGLLVPPKDPSAMAAAIDRVIEDSDLRRRLIAEGAEKVKDWTIEKFVDRILQIYEQL